MDIFTLTEWIAFATIIVSLSTVITMKFVDKWCTPRYCSLCKKEMEK